MATGNVVQCSASYSVSTNQFTKVVTLYALTWPGVRFLSSAPYKSCCVLCIGGLMHARRPWGFSGVGNLGA